MTDQTHHFVLYQFLIDPVGGVRLLFVGHSEEEALAALSEIGKKLAREWNSKREQAFEDGFAVERKMMTTDFYRGYAITEVWDGGQKRLL